MEKELAEYRARKAKELGQPPINKTFERLLESNRILNHPDSVKSDLRVNNEPEVAERDEKDDLASEGGVLYWSTVVLKVLLWFSLWMLFVRVEFGSVYVVVSSLFLLWSNLRVRRGGGRRKEGDLSAYSVFNPNFEVLDGTLTAEQFEKEIRHKL